jgi:hypothetical protein
MANDVRVRFKSFLPGAGFDSSGGAKQGKTRVVGTVTVTSYNGESGEPLSAVDVGLSTIDSITLRVREEYNTGSGTVRTAPYSTSTGQFYLQTTLMTTGAISKVATAATETLEFVAEGDSANDVELT